MATKKEAQHQKKPKPAGQKTAPKKPGGGDFGKMASLLKKKFK